MLSNCQTNQSGKRSKLTKTKIQRLNNWTALQKLTSSQINKQKPIFEELWGKTTGQVSKHTTTKDGWFKLETNESQDGSKNKSFTIVQNLQYKNIGVKFST